jgi:asparagine synthase (glutamine-hydrolysing)
VSGFAGMVSLDGALPDTRLLERMAQTLAFRGPDGTHITTKPGAGFCFTFLRTGPAPQCPSQPCSLEGRVWLLGDVRLDGRDDLRRKLEQHGDEISEDVTDEELVLRTWRLWGENGIAELIGDYAFALCDVEARILRCWRDLIGARPFFYAYVGDWLYFSNTLNTLRCVPAVSRELDHHFIGDFLLPDSCPDLTRSVFRDISRLRAGYALHYSTAGLHEHRFVSFPIEEPLWLTREEQYVEQFRSLYRQAVLDRLPQTSAAIFMSGGLDSTSIAAMAAQLAKSEENKPALRSYTIDCRPLFDDEEGYYATLAAKKFSVPIEILSAGSCLPYEGWTDPGLPTPEPFHEPFLLLNQRQYRQAACDAKVALFGYGGDDVLTGQSWPYLVYLFRRRRLNDIIKAFGGYIARHGRIPPLRGGFLVRWRRLTGRDSFAARYPDWVVPSLLTQRRLREREAESVSVPDAIHPVHPRAYALFSSGSWSGVLEGEDPCWTGAQLEARMPLLDQRLLRFLFQVPAVPLCINKRLLRLAFHDVLPREIQSRPKTPLRGDPLQIYLESGKWSPLPLSEPAADMRSYVDWNKFRAALGTGTGQDALKDLHVISLNYWLKSIEKEQRIR